MKEKEFENFINNYAHWIIYIRQNLEFPCPDCYSEISNEGSGLCPTCYGTGHVITLERIPVRFRRFSLTHDAGLAQGIMSDFDMLVYFKQTAYPKQTDLVLEVEWNVPISSIESQGQPTSIIHVYRLKELEAYREEELSFFVGGCSIEDSTKEFLQKTILSTGI